MRRLFMVLATALSMVMLEVVAAASAAPGPVTGPSYPTGFEPTKIALALPGANTAGGGVAKAAIPGGDITAVCTGSVNGSTFTLTADCGPVSTSLTVPPAITTVDGAGHTISADDNGQGDAQFNGGIVTNAGSGQTMNIQNVTITGPAAGFQLCTNAGFVLYGIYFNGAAGGSVSNVTVQHIFQFQNNAFGSCQTGRAIRADDSGTITITGTTVTDYQKSGFEARGSTIMNLSGSTAGPSHPLENLEAQNGVTFVGAAGTVANNTIFGSGYTQTIGGPGASTAMLLFGAHDVTVTNNTLTSPVGRPGTDIGISVNIGSSNILISFNRIERLGPDVPDDVGHGIDVFTPDGSSATLICNTFNLWVINVVGAEQIACAPLPNGTACRAYSAPAPVVDSGKNYDEGGDIIDATPFTWTVDSGTLPPGLTLSSGGAITGVPTTAGTFNFTVKLVDATGLTATRAQTITIAPADCAPPPPPPPPPPPRPPPPPKLVLRKVSNKHVVHGGGTIRFTITIRAVGTGKATNVRVCDTLPPGLVFVRAPGATFSGGRACWRIASISAGQSKSYRVTVRADSVQRATARTNVATAVAAGTNCTARRPCRARARVLVRPHVKKVLAVKSPRFTG